MRVLQSEDDARQFVFRRCAPDDFRRVERFVSLLRSANEHQNLISRQTVTSVWLRHVADSAQLFDHVPRETSPWMDLGTGAGFPGLILAAMQPHRSFVLVESRTLRVQWLQQAITQLKLRNCDLVGSDVRKIARFDAAVISARAFAPLERLVAQAARFSTAATCWVLPKGRSATQEVEAMPSPLRSMFHVKQSRTSEDAGIVLGTGKVDMAA